MQHLSLIAVPVLLLAACNAPRSAGAPADFEDLTLRAKWRGYNQATVPAGWIIEDGVIHLSTPGGADLLTVEQYANFELTFEWKISPEGNSGVMYRVSEGEGPAYVTGPEYQVFDNAAMQRHDPYLAAGANYAMHGKPGDDTRPVGEWNTARIVVDGAHVEHWLNGVLQCEYELWSDAWKERVQSCKWQDTPGYGIHRAGHIALQDHGSPVWYRGVGVKRL
jgi:hypothetical protein